MKILFATFFCFALCACTDNAADSSPPPSLSSSPLRVVSLDVCADQYVLKFVPPERILALSPDAAKPFSYMAKSAEGIPTVRSSAEDVMMLKPDLIVRSYGGGPNAERFFAQADIPVITLGWAATLSDIQTNVKDTAAALGAPDHGEQVAAEMQARIAALAVKSPPPKAMYMTPTGATSGSGTLIDELMQTAGLSNYDMRTGWQSLPLERLAHEAPDLIVTAFFDSSANNLNGWSSSRHPVAENLMNSRPIVDLPGAWTSCNGWFTLDAVEAMAKGAQ
ncbi:MAG: ABC transporter substrate-binding protein [Hyphomonas sp.]